MGIPSQPKSRVKPINKSEFNICSAGFFMALFNKRTPKLTTPSYSIFSPQTLTSNPASQNSPRPRGRRWRSSDGTGASRRRTSSPGAWVGFGRATRGSEPRVAASLAEETPAPHCHPEARVDWAGKKAEPLPTSDVLRPSKVFFLLLYLPFSATKYSLSLFFLSSNHLIFSILKNVRQADYLDFLAWVSSSSSNFGFPAKWGADIIDMCS